MLWIPKNAGLLSRCAEFLNRQVQSLSSLTPVEGFTSRAPVGTRLERSPAPTQILNERRATSPATANPGERGEVGCFSIAVCGEEEVPNFHKDGITDILTCVSPERPVIKPNWPTLRNHLIVRCDDVEEPLPHHTHPTEDHVRQMIAFGQGALQRCQRGNVVRVLVHCAAGISRSTAATLLILAMKYGKGAEATALRHLTRIRPQCRPNAAIVEHGDRLLHREGRLAREVATWKASVRRNVYAS